ncbi:MAG: Vi polysaccharide biosynthesis protein VipA/TviB, partial [Bacteroidota bacterium]
MSINNKYKISVIGLGYVGLPLAVEFGKKFHTIGFDINEIRVQELRKGIDKTLEISSADLVDVLNNKYFSVTSEINEIKDCNVYIITVPTPTDKNNRPVLTPLIKASETIGSVLKKGDIVIYESTVYPGVTEDECVPVLEKISGLSFNIDFFVGYSPERINPGDKTHTVTKILKVTSGSTPEIAEEIDSIYKTIITAGTHKASSIKVAEAAKVIENSQRDINIAFVNELSKIFNLLNISTQE